MVSSPQPVYTSLRVVFVTHLNLYEKVIRECKCASVDIMYVRV